MDFFPISNDLNKVVRSCCILNTPESDHSVTTLRLQSEDVALPRGPGFWKLDNSLLEDTNYVDQLRENIPVFEKKYADTEDSRLKWDLIKMEIRGFTVKYTKIKTKTQRNGEFILLKRANELSQEVKKNPKDKRLSNELYAIKLRLKTKVKLNDDTFITNQSEKILRITVQIVQY